jgi:hypothetical protein
MCGFNDALDRGHSVEDMLEKGFSLQLGADGKVEWKVGEEMEGGTDEDQEQEGRPRAPG